VSNPVVPPPSGPENGLPPAEQPASPQSGEVTSDPAGGHAYLPPAPEERPGLRPKLLKALAVLVALVITLFIKIVFFGDTARAADVGDCIAASQDVSGQGATDAEAEVVDCGSAEAAYVVVGKVIGVSDIESSACDQYFKEGDQFFVYGSKSSTGEFLLCLRPSSAGAN